MPYRYTYKPLIFQYIVISMNLYASILSVFIKFAQY